MIYLDPPFNSSRNYNVLFKEGLVDSEAQIHAFEDSWHWTHETQKEFEHLVHNAPDTVSSLILAMEQAVGHNDVLAYLTMMTIRLLELHRVLKETGSIYLHCDPTASHYLKIVMDAIFGKQNFRNEIIWHKNSGGIGRSAFSKRHDTLLFYSKSKNYFYDGKAVGELREQAKGTFSGYFGKDDDGREYREVRKAGKIYKYYMDEPRNPEDVWEVPQIPERDKTERLGYPTQKPEKLLERVILASSKKGDWVLDPFCGCGTTVSVSEQLERNWIGIDISMLAIKLIERRLVKRHPRLKNQIHINGLPRDMAGAKELFEQDPWDFEYWVAVHLLDAKPPAGKTQGNMKGADRGIDGVITLITDSHNGETEYGRAIVQVKGGHVQRNHIATLKGDMQTQRAIAGVFVSLERPTSPMKQEAAQAGTVRTQLGEFPSVQILTVEDLLSGKRPNLPGMVSPYKQALAFNPTIPQTSLI